jgi:hypothetical protein
MLANVHVKKRARAHQEICAPCSDKSMVEYVDNAFQLYIHRRGQRYVDQSLDNLPDHTL